MNTFPSSFPGYGHRQANWPQHPTGHPGKSQSHNRPHTPQPVEQKTSSAAQYLQLTGKESQRSTEISLTTRDGDTVTISLAAVTRSAERAQVDIVGNSSSGSEGAKQDLQVVQAESTSSKVSLEALFNQDALKSGSFKYSTEEEKRSVVKYTQEDANGLTRFTLDSRSSMEADFSIDVEGELDAGELKAISELISGLDSISTSFFSGEMENALAQGSALGYDESEIANFSFQVEKSDRSVALEQYRQYQAPASNSRPPLPDSVSRPVGKYLRDLAHIDMNSDKIKRAETMDLIVSQLVERNAQLKSDQFNGHELLAEKARFESFNQRLFKLIFAA